MAHNYKNDHIYFAIHIEYISRLAQEHGASPEVLEALQFSMDVAHKLRQEVLDEPQHPPAGAQERHVRHRRPVPGDDARARGGIVGAAESSPEIALQPQRYGDAEEIQRATPKQPLNCRFSSHCATSCCISWVLCASVSLW